MNWLKRTRPVTSVFCRAAWQRMLLACGAAAFLWLMVFWSVKG